MGRDEIKLYIDIGTQGSVEYIPRTCDGLKTIINSLDAQVVEVTVKKEPAQYAPEKY